MNAISRSGVTGMIGAVSMLLGAANVASAQRVPFFVGGPTAFQPEISVVQSGALNDVQAVVSADRRYVTLNMRATNSALLALRDYTFQNGPNGRNAGSGPPVPAAAVGFVGLGRTEDAPGPITRAGGTPAASAASGAVETSPSAIRRAAKASLLERPGMIRLDRPEVPRSRAAPEARDLRRGID